MMERVTVLVKCAIINGEARFEFEQLDGELNIEELAQFLELSSQFIYKYFPHLKDGESHD